MGSIVSIKNKTKKWSHKIGIWNAAALNITWSSTSHACRLLFTPNWDYSDDFVSLCTQGPSLQFTDNSRIQTILSFCDISNWAIKPATACNDFLFLNIILPSLLVCVCVRVGGGGGCYWNGCPLNTNRNVLSTIKECKALYPAKCRSKGQAKCKSGMQTDWKARKWTENHMPGSWLKTFLKAKHCMKNQYPLLHLQGVTALHQHFHVLGKLRKLFLQLIKPAFPSDVNTRSTSLQVLVSVTKTSQPPSY